MDIYNFLYHLLIWAPSAVLAITLHEAAHGYVARHFGDMTAHAQGRISLNPLRHVDLVGTLLVPLAILLVSGGKFLFGWAKPVPVNYSALRKPRQHMAWVAAAGPGANLAMALAWAALLKVAVLLPAGQAGDFLELMSQAGILVNLIFMFLNLLPIPPLDGGRILTSLLPSRAAWRFAKIEPWGLPILLVLLFTNVLNGVLGPLVDVSGALIRAIVL